MRMRAFGLAVVAAAILGTAAIAADTRFERSLKMLAPEERLEQLCDYTAMTRIRNEAKQFRPFGFERKKPFLHLEEQLKILRLFFDRREPFSYSGPIWSIDEATLYTGPYDAKRSIPLIVMGGPGRAVEIAAKHADGWLCFLPQMGTAEWYAQRAPALVKGSKESAAHFRLGLKAASALYRVGELEEAARLFDAAAQSARTTSNLPMQSVIEAELKLGLREAARARLLASISLPNIDRQALVGPRSRGGDERRTRYLSRDAARRNRRRV